MDTIEYFKRAAKIELKALRAAGNTDAQLQPVQHQIAVDAGYRSWGALRASDEYERQLAVVMHQHPRLNMVGFGENLFQKDRDVRRQEFEADRAELRGNARRLEPITAWLQEHVEPRKTVNHLAGSYGMKHLFEADKYYIVNGEFVAAALIAGYPMREGGPNSPNATFGMSERSRRTIWRRIHG